jgi:hypothetical protein
MCVCGWEGGESPLRGHPGGCIRGHHCWLCAGKCIVRLPSLHRALSRPIPCKRRSRDQPAQILPQMDSGASPSAGSTNGTPRARTVLLEERHRRSKRGGPCMCSGGRPYSIPPCKRSPYEGRILLSDILNRRRPVGFVGECYLIRGGTL